jgi:hypothetical protein
MRSEKAKCLSASSLAVGVYRLERDIGRGWSLGGDFPQQKKYYFIYKKNDEQTYPNRRKFLL